MSRKVKLIFNPIANLGRAWTLTSLLRPVVYDLGGADWNGTAYPTHATELAARSADEGYDLVIAIGGDGTMHEVLNGLMQIPAERRPALGVVPVGSGNDFAFSCGISSNPVEALRQMLTGEPHPIDIGSVTTKAEHTEFWANAIGIGFDTIVVLQSRQITSLHGFNAYLLAALRTIFFHYEPFHLRITADDLTTENDLLMLVLMNGRREGGGFHVTPQARSDDGVLDLMAMDKVSRLRLLRILPEVLNGTHEKLKDCQFESFHQIEIHSDRPLYVHADGEIITTPEAHCQILSAQIIQNAIQVIR